MKLAIITGGSKGLGLALTEKYAKENWAIKELSRSGSAPHSVPCDFSQREASSQCLDSLFEELKKTPWDEIHLINNAGRLGYIGPIAKSSPSDWFASMDVNFGALVQSTGIFAQHFQGHPARKVMAAVSSGAAKKSYQGWALYCSTKAAMERFSSCFAEEQKSQACPIETVIINPGIMDTNMQSEIRSSKPEDFPTLSRFIQLKENNALPQAARVAENIYQILTQELEAGQEYSAQAGLSWIGQKK